MLCVEKSMTEFENHLEHIANGMPANGQISNNRNLFEFYKISANYIREGGWKYAFMPKNWHLVGNVCNNFTH